MRFQEISEGKSLMEYTQINTMANLGVKFAVT